jgi:hypothetical protein
VEETVVAEYDHEADTRRNRRLAKCASPPLPHP